MFRNAGNDRYGVVQKVFVAQKQYVFVLPPGPPSQHMVPVEPRACATKDHFLCKFIDRYTADLKGPAGEESVERIRQ